MRLLPSNWWDVIGRGGGLFDRQDVIQHICLSMCYDRTLRQQVDDCDNFAYFASEDPNDRNAWDSDDEDVDEPVA